MVVNAIFLARLDFGCQIEPFLWTLEKLHPIAFPSPGAGNLGTWETLLSEKSIFMTYESRVSPTWTYLISPFCSPLDTVGRCSNDVAGAELDELHFP